MAAALRSQGRGMHVLDLTHDFSIPVAAAVASGSDGRDLAFGFAAAAAPNRAIESAVGELAQFEVTRRFRQIRSTDHFDWMDWCRKTPISRQLHLHPSGAKPRSHSTCFLTVESCVQMCEERGLRFLYVDLTRPDIGMPVARVIVPGLRPIWPRFAAGRLYDVPVSLGWRKRRISEARINPVPILY
jgi:ribosomal protein S12 methylthiotransferase accessory factor